MTENPITEIETVARAALKGTRKQKQAALIAILDLCRASQEGHIYRAWTDGACFPNPGGKGGFAYVIKGPDDQITEGGGHEPSSTNNRMELRAAIAAIEAVPEGKTLRLRTDSQYVQKGITAWIKNWKKNGWQTKEKTPVKNADLWRDLDVLCQSRTVLWLWVKGHNGNTMNERADELARRWAYRKETCI